MNELTEHLRTSYAPSVPYEVEVPEKPVTALLESAAAFYPERVAIDFLGATTTYEQLVDQVRRAATVLRMAGVRAGDTVGFLLPNCPQHIVAFYAVQYLGATVAEHNPLAPPSQIEQQMRNHGGKVAVVWESSLDKVAPYASRNGVRLMTVDLTRAMNPIAQFALNLPFKFARKQRNKLRPERPLPPAIPSFDDLAKLAAPWQGQCPSHPSDTAVLLHTGGTTGTPKSVELTHHNLMANVAQSAAWVPNLHEGAEVFAATLPFFHAFGMTLSLLAAVRMAASICVLPTFDVDLVLAAQRRRPITFFPGVAPMFKRLRKRALETAADMSSIRYSLSGAMPLTRQIASDWEDLTGGYIIEGYGMTEGSPILLGNPVSPLRRPGTLGIPYPSTQVRLADPDNPSRDVAEGENGEILVRGPQVFKGYLGNAVETESAFADGWLRTGDIGRVEDGFVVMSDRKKELIITGGFNVYPTEVEEAVRSMPGIDDVAVVGVPDASSGERIVAAIVADGSASINLEDVRAWAERTLSHYALPKQIALVTDLPRSQVGKVLRRTVREQLLAASESASASLQNATAGLAQASSKLKDLSSQAREQIAATADQIVSTAEGIARSRVGDAEAVDGTEAGKKGDHSEAVPAANDAAATDQTTAQEE